MRLVISILVAAVIGLLIWGSPFGSNDLTGYTRQVSNINYVQAGGVSVKHSTPVVALGFLSAVNYAAPACSFNGGDLFNPAGTSNSQIGEGSSITFRAGGVQQTIDLPGPMVHHQLYAGKDIRVQFSYNKVVLYYDHSWDSLRADNGSSTSPGWHSAFWGWWNNPKKRVLECFASSGASSLPQRMMIGLRYATIFMPTHSGLMK